MAETCERDTSSRRIGSAPISRIFARSWASSIVNEPEICAPFWPSMPSGFSSKSMYGAEISSLSRTIAKCCETFAGIWVGSALSDPRCAISRVISWNALRPLSVKSN